MEYYSKSPLEDPKYLIILIILACIAVAAITLYKMGFYSLPVVANQCTVPDYFSCTNVSASWDTISFTLKNIAAGPIYNLNLSLTEGGCDYKFVHTFEKKEIMQVSFTCYGLPQKDERFISPMIMEYQLINNGLFHTSEASVQADIE